MQGSLFTDYFLREGVTEMPGWAGVKPAEVELFRADVKNLFKEFSTDGAPNEATTEKDIIVPVLGALGWQHMLPKQTATREDIPDILLLQDARAKAAANRERRGPARYKHGIAIAESKAWDLPLDRGPPDLFNQAAPSTQMLRYLSRVEIESERAIQWGILTNGRLWRLYFQGARSRSEEFLELDLPVLAGVPGIETDLLSPAPDQRHHLLKVFLLMFRRQAFLPDLEDARTFHRQCLERTREWEARVSQDLSEVVFDEVFPRLIDALASSDLRTSKTTDSTYLDEVRRAALTLLYRLLFVLYAEDRNLLPSHERGYDDYSLRKLRLEIHGRIDRRDQFSARANSIYERLTTAFRLIDLGDPEIGLPPYNGGLFESRADDLLSRAKPSDAELAPLLDLLTRRAEKGVKKWISYRDLSVQHLGSIYERLLEYAVAIEDSKIVVRLNPFARKGSGSYYTHEDLVRLIIERTVGPLVEERVEAFKARAGKLKSGRRPKAERLDELCPLDPATRVLDLKVCDPAMGSGHFLVSLVDYLADRILEAMAEATATVDWADPEKPYVSPLVARIASIRERIWSQAEREGWKIERSQLDDRHIVRRMILKRVVYGVDKNPMAVELAKVALWLHTFTVGAPLSFLDHHLRCGDSLFGERVRPVEDMLTERAGMLLNPSVAKARNSAKGMLTVENLTDADIAEVRTSATTFSGVEEATAPLTKFLDVVHAFRWLEAANKSEAAAVRGFYDGQFGDPVAIANGTETPKGKEANALAKSLKKARELVDEQRFLHWEVAFPGVWSNWESMEPAGGFDAVIGNPPWDRIKLQEVEWFATRKPEIAHAVRAADRKRMIGELERKSDPLWHDYLAARERAERMAEVARGSGEYPLLSGGDTNIYSLFVERAQRLVKPDGLVGLLVPSGIASDLSASKFFKTVATGGRVAALLDFENRWPTYFADVDSRFKFSVFVTGGKARTFAETLCGFFLHHMADVAERAFALAPEDFARLNPNTGTAPVFRTRRDAEITRAIYGRLPVIVRHVPGGNQAVWPVRYMRMFDMTNDSALFKTRAELEAQGFYPVNGNRLKKGKAECVPLYEGKMVQAYDHRAASVVVNPQNLNRPAQPEPATSHQSSDPAWLPSPQFWVEVGGIDWPRWRAYPDGLGWTIGFKDVTAPTNERTMIAATVPFAGFGNTLPIIVPALPPKPEQQSDEKALAEWEAEAEALFDRYKTYAPLLLGNLNASAFDYVARQKVQGQHLNWYIVEQLPVVPPKAFEQKIGKRKIADFVRGEVLRLTYAAHDMAPFARDMGYDGPPFAWDEEDRRHRRARLDALFFRLYGIGEEEAAYILDTFPIVREHDEKEFGRFRTKDLVLGYMRALAAGDLESRLAL